MSTEANSSEGSTWWGQPRENVAQYVSSFYAELSRQNQWRAVDYTHFERLYENRRGVSATVTGTQYRPTYNLCKSATDILFNQVVRSLVRPRILCTGGNKSLRDKAKNLQRWVDYQFRDAHVRREMQKILHDSLTYGTGVGKPWRDGSHIGFERVYPGELYVDVGEAVYGQPYQLMQVKMVDEEYLVRRYPQHEREIRAASSSYNPLTTLDMATGDASMSATRRVQVNEVWRRATRSGDGGKHAICIQGCTLVYEDYKKDHFPFVFINHTDRKRQFWGIGVVEELYGLQRQMNRMMWQSDEALRLTTAPMVLLNRGSNIKSTEITNRVAQILQYTGERPQVWAPNPISQDIWREIGEVWIRGHEQVGANAPAMGRIPSGLETGAAVREAVDASNARFSGLIQRWEAAHLELARQMIELGKEIYQSNKKYSVVSYADRYTIQQVDWKKLDLKKDSYVLSVEPASALPTTPSGKIATVGDLYQMGLIDQKTTLRLIDMPDLEEELSLARAASDSIDKHIETMVDEGIQEVPEPFMDLQLALKKVQTSYNMYRSLDIPEDRLELLRNYMAKTKQLMDEAMAASQMGPPPPGAPVEAPAPGPNGAPPAAATAGDGEIPV